MTKKLNIGLTGTMFMGRAHSNAFSQVSKFFNLAFTPILHTVCGRDKKQLFSFAKDFGWLHTDTSWEKMVENEEIDLVDICVPNNLHAPIALAAAEKGKHILCEKPLAMNVEEAYKMWKLVEQKQVVNMVVFNYRFVPAIALAKKIISSGKIGKIRHFNAVYYQDWLVNKDSPLVWRHDISLAGSGAHGDMNAHIIDLGRYLVGEFKEVNGWKKTFIKERPLEDGSGLGKVSADDSAVFMASFDNGAFGSFMATRMAPGKKNFLRLEIFGSEGTLLFNLERLNELQLYINDEDQYLKGFQKILVTEKGHPYINAWWPPGHIIGWEHSFIHLVKDMIETINGNKVEIPTFYDGYKCQQILDAVMISANQRNWVMID